MASQSTTSETFEYSSLSRLNTLEVYQFLATKREQPAYWIVYIHGGAWRDPEINASSISATLPYLTKCSAQIDGVASLNYRLSPYPGHATDPSGDDPARNVSHPRHIEDVLSAITWLQEKYGFEERYILVGHSAGATLALQAVTGHWKSGETASSLSSATFIPPVCVAGAAGIYDMELLIESFSTIPAYRELIEGAFGKDVEIWREASPANFDLKALWTNAQLVIIADSDEDELINTAQSEQMLRQLQTQATPGRRDIWMKVKGSHDSIWSNGEELAKVIIHALEILVEGSSSKLGINTRTD